MRVRVVHCEICDVKHWNITQRCNKCIVCASLLMKYAFFASLDEINGIFIPFFKYPLCISIVKNREVGGIHDECFQQYILAGPFLVCIGGSKKLRRGGGGGGWGPPNVLRMTQLAVRTSLGKRGSVSVFLRNL